MADFEASFCQSLELLGEDKRLLVSGQVCQRQTSVAHLARGLEGRCSVDPFGVTNSVSLWALSNAVQRTNLRNLWITRTSN